MAVFLWKAKTTYVAVPKVACTSLKTMFFEFENRRPFQTVIANGRKYHVHNYYPDGKFADLPRERIADHARFALVRDPIRRFLSSYSNRVVSLKELSVEKAGRALEARRLAPDPDLGLFIDRLDDYRAAVDSIRHHTAPMVHFLGAEPGFYAGLFPIERMDDFLAALSDRLGEPMRAPVLQTGGPKLDPSVLTAPQIALLKRRYHDDYNVFGAFL